MTGPSWSNEHEENQVDASLSRRRILAVGGAGAIVLSAGAAGVAAAVPGEVKAAAGTSSPVVGAAPAAAMAPGVVCVLSTEMTKGPYYLNGQYIRADISEGKPGIPLKVTLMVVDQYCLPVPGALVELWHADALGEYSGFVGNNGHSEADDRTFLRGGTFTNSSGRATVTTVYPGWYNGRCIHIHLKVHTGVVVTGTTYTGGNVCHTGQLFIPEDVTTAVAALPPYSTNTVRRTPLTSDGIYRQSGGGATAGLLTATALGSSPAAGYTASGIVGVNTSATHNG